MQVYADTVSKKHFEITVIVFRFLSTSSIVDLFVLGIINLRFIFSVIVVDFIFMVLVGMAWKVRNMDTNKCSSLWLTVSVDTTANTKKASIATMFLLLCTFNCLQLDVYIGAVKGNG